MLITEFVPLGDLRNYLRGFKVIVIVCTFVCYLSALIHSICIISLLLSTQNRHQEVPMDRLVSFSCQIAEGMEYLVCTAVYVYGSDLLVHTHSHLVL